MFSKSGYFTSNFIFENQIVPALQTSLYCETWYFFIKKYKNVLKGEDLIRMQVAMLVNLISSLKKFCI